MTEYNAIPLIKVIDNMALSLEQASFMSGTENLNLLNLNLTPKAVKNAYLTTFINLFSKL